MNVCIDEAVDEVDDAVDKVEGVDEVNTEEEADCTFEEMTRRFNELRREKIEYDPVGCLVG